MSDEIPFHIQEEIMKRLPVKSLVQFRSVSKAWKSLIDSSHFIAAHCVHNHTQPQHHLLVSFRTLEKEVNYVCFVDDETLFQQRPAPNSPLFVKEDVSEKIVGISHGLVCFLSHDAKLVVLWNPSIRKLIDVAVPNTPYVVKQFVGFWVCPVTIDPKIVAIRQSWDKSNMETSYQCDVMVYTLSSGNWTSLSTNLPTIPLRNRGRVVAIDGFCYWRGELPGNNMIVSFDVTNESFEMIELPDSVAHHDPKDLYIYKLRESLAILQYDRSIYTIWKMEGDGQRSFTKLFTIHAPAYSLVGFRKSGVPILRVTNDEQIKLVVYEPNSEHNIVLEVSGDSDPFAVNSYTETLLLLGRSDCSSY